jgi:hypothetical protein
MATPQWMPISATDEAYCQQFVKVMQFMDQRYGVLAASQLQEWLQGTSGPYVGQKIGAFAWFPRVEDMPFPTRMQMVLLGQYKPADSLAYLLMLGWVPATDRCEPDFLDGIVDEILAQGADWLNSLGSPVKIISTIRPNVMRHKPVQRLHDRFYARATASTSSGGYVRLVRERALPNAALWQLQIIA